MKLIIVLVISLLIASCTGGGNVKNNTMKESKQLTDSTKQYGFNRDFLERHTEVIELRKGTSAIAIAPEWQGRVMTSTSEGDNGFSFGWINRELIAGGKRLPHINAFGGEERLWLGPEGGQFSLFFGKGKPFTYENWQTPGFMDTTPFDLIAKTDSSAQFALDVETENYSGTALSFRLERVVTMLTGKDLTLETGIDPEGLNCVAYRSDNTIINKGEMAWKKETGLLSVWMLGMFIPSPSVVVVIPVKPGDEKVDGPMVNDNYFGKVAADRLRVKGNHIFFRADGKSRGKIGIPPLRAAGTMGSYDSENKILTLLICRMPEKPGVYVNSAWELQEKPFSGDALNSYNDGPLADGTQMGPFYELETSSAAAELQPGGKLTHTQYTLHITGNPQLLDKVSRKVLGVSLEEIKGSF
jgi:hypothetical protein